MSFITNYSNLTVGGNTGAGNLTANNINLGNISDVIVGGGGTEGQLLSTDGLGNLSWVTQVPAPGPAGVQNQIQFNDNGTMGTAQGFTFSEATRELSVPTIVASNVSVSTLNAQSVTDLVISGTQLPGQALTSYGNGRVHYTYATGTGMNVTEPQVDLDTQFLPQGTLPVGATAGTIEVLLNPSVGLVVGDVISFANDPTWLLTITSVSNNPFPGLVIQNVTWTPAIRRAVPTASGNTTNILRLRPVQEFANISFSGTLTGSVSNTSVGNRLNINLPVPGSNSQIITTQNGTTATSSSLFSLSRFDGTSNTPDQIVVGNAIAYGNVSSVSNISLGGNTIILDTNQGVHNAAIITSLFGAVTANKKSNVSANSFQSVGGYRRGLRFAEYRIGATNSIPSTSWTAPYWQVVEDSISVLTPNTQTAGVLSWTNNTNGTLLLYVSAQIVWIKEGSGNRRVGVSVNGNTQGVYGLASQKLNGSDDLVMTTSVTIKLDPGQYFQPIVWQNWANPTSIGGAGAGMPSGESCRLTFTVLN